VVAALPIDGMVRNLAMHAVLASRDGDRWTLNMDPGHQVLATPERINALQQALGTAMTKRISLDVVALAGTTGTPAERAEAARLKKLQQTRDSISRDPVVQTLVRDFNARLDIESIEPD
jgi:DNA polymerase-3 subunit gamma/tau